jgi:TRAP-type C4-dicarboxylate transport system permease small subunit
MRILHRLGLTLLDLLSRVTTAIAGTAVLGMAAAELWQVIARYVLNDAPSWTEPVALLCMSTAMMFGAAAGVRANRHFSFNLLAEASPPGLRRGLHTLQWLIAAGIGLMLMGWGGVMVRDAWDYPMSGAPLPQGLTFLPLSVGGALIAVFAIERLLRPLNEKAEI